MSWLSCYSNIGLLSTGKHIWACFTTRVTIAYLEIIHRCMHVRRECQCAMPIADRPDEIVDSDRRHYGLMPGPSAVNRRGLEWRWIKGGLDWIIRLFNPWTFSPIRLRKEPENSRYRNRLKRFNVVKNTQLRTLFFIQNHSQKHQ